MSNKKPVIVAGAGPVGCVTALSLVQQGIPVILLEAEDVLPIDMRGSTFHPPTLDMLAKLGIVDSMIEEGLIADTFQYRDRASGKSAIFDLSLLKNDTNHPYRLQCEQYKLTRIICERLSHSDLAEIQFGAKVLHVKNEKDQVNVTLSLKGETIEMTTPFLIGADGGSSAVRKSLGVSFEGFTYPDRFLIVNTPFEFKKHLPDLCYVNYISDPEEWCVLLRVTDVWRVLLPTEPNTSDEEVLNSELIQNRLNGLIHGNESFPVTFKTVYHVHQRVAEKYRIGRVLLAGDAAHLNNPLGGMGMNGGIHDAINLVDKLVRIEQGAEWGHQLDLYQEERRNLTIQFIQEQSIKNKQSIEEREKDKQSKRHQELMTIAQDPVRSREAMLESSMIKMLRASNSGFNIM